MQIERERFLGAGRYERTAERRGYPRKITPGTARAGDPQNRLQKQPPVHPGPAGVGRLAQAVQLHLRPLRGRVLDPGHLASAALVDWAGIDLGG
jgi:hypothetical protein